MSDLISRQDIKYHTQLEAMGNGQYEEVEVAYKNDIESLPSADRPTGEWIWSPKDKDETVSGCCSNCSFSHLFIGGHTAQYNYCPNCGAKMVREDGEA